MIRNHLQPDICIAEAVPQPSQIAKCVSNPIDSHWHDQKCKDPERERLHFFTNDSVTQTRQKYTRIHRNHSIRPGYLPAHFRVSNKLAQDKWVVGILPDRLNLIQRIHNLPAKEKERPLGKLMTLKSIN